MFLRTLGGLRLEGSDFQRSKPLLFLAYLALEGPQERYALARLFWPGMDTGLDNVTTTLTRLRRVLPDYLDINNTYVRVNLNHDIQNFEAAFQQQHWEKVTELYQGPFLQGVQLEDDNLELEEWVYKKREQFAANVRTTFLHLAKQEANLNHFDRASHFALKAYDLPYAPFEIDDFELLYKLLKASNHPKAREISKEAKEFGLDLSFSETESRQSFLRPKPKELPTLPLQSTLFIGREKEIASITEQLKECRLLTLIGPGGIGKTRLSLAVAHHAKPFTDGVFFVPLDVLSSASEVVFAIANALDIQLSGHAQEQVLSYLKSKHLLLILDNYEHLLGDVSFIQDILASAPQVHLLVTSRESLGLQSEYLFDVRGLKLPDKKLEVTEALHLFAERARHQKPDFVLDNTTIPSVTHICQLLDGMPLALELAASWLRVLSLDELVAELRSDLELLSANVKDVSPRHHSIQQVFEASWEKLSPGEQNALQRLTIFQGGFSREAAHAITGLDLRMLLKLINKSFLRRDGPGRFSQHPLLSQYLRLKTLSLEPQRDLEDQHAHYYLLKLKTNVAHLRTIKAKETRETLDFEMANIYAAWNYLLREFQLDSLTVFSQSLSQFMDSHYDHEAVELFSHAATLFDNTRPEHHRVLGYMLILQGKHALNLGAGVHPLLEITKRGLALLKPLNEYSGILTGEITLGYLARLQGNLQESLDIFTKALALARHQGNPQDIGNCIDWLCSTKISIDNSSMSEQFLRESLIELRSLGDLVNLAYGLYIFGSFMVLNDKLEEGEKLLKESLMVEEQSHFLAIPIQSSLARIALKRGDIKEAEELINEALEKASRMGDVFTLQLTLALMGKLKLEQGLFAEAEQALVSSLEQNWSRNMIIAVSHTLVRVIELNLALDRPAYALTLLYFLRDYPTVGRMERIEVRQLLEHHTYQLSKTKRSQFEKKAKILTMETVVNSVLREKSKRFSFD